MNPWESSYSSLYPLVIEGNVIFKILASITFLVVYIN